MPHYLSASSRSSEYLLVVGNRLLLPCAQIKSFNFPASRARIIVGISAGENYVEHLSALVAANRHWHWEAQFHKLCSLPPNDEHQRREPAATEQAIQTE